MTGKYNETFTGKLWKTIQPVFEQITNCEFVKRLIDGTLPHNWFAHYLSQDALYIIDDSKALAFTAAKAENPDEMYFFLKLAKDGLDIERELHKNFIQKLKIPVAKEKSPAFKAYTDFLLDHAYHSSYPVAVSALLPCFWVYYKVGDHIFKNAFSDNPYKKWIDTYSGEEYSNYTEKFIQITERHGQKADSFIQEQMELVFIEGTKHELRVFEEAAEK